MNYQLDIDFDQNDLNNFMQNNCKIIVIKEVSSPSGTKPVAWAALSPMTHNTISWSTDFAAFVSRTEPVPGVMINADNQSRLDFSQTIPYRSSVFGAAEKNPSIPQGSMAIINQDGGHAITGGLSLACNANGSSGLPSPICAAKINQNQQAMFSPSESVRVYMAPNISTGTLIGELPLSASEVTFGHGNYNRTIHYDGHAQRFVY